MKTTIGKCCEIIRNGASIKQTDGAEGIPITRIESIANGTLNLNKLGFANIFDENKYSDYYLKKGDILMSHINSLKHLGKTAIVKEELEKDIIHGMNLLLLRVHKDIHSKFIKYYFETFEFYNDILKIANQSVNQSSFTVTKLKDVLIPLPPLATQKAIAEKLDKADALRKKDQELLKQYDELAQSIFIEMFGDPVHNEKGWDLINFEEVLKLKRGYDLPVQDRNQNGNIPVYGSNGILDYHTISKTNKPCIVTGRSGTIGKVHRTEQNCWPLNTTLYSYEIYDNNITYLEYLLNNLRIDRFAHGAGVPTLDRKIVHKEFIPNIKVELQNQFAEKIKNIEAQKELVKKQAEASENLFQALLQESFSFT